MTELRRIPLPKGGNNASGSRNPQFAFADTPPGTGGVSEGRGGRSSPKLILCLNLSTSPGSLGSPSPPVPGGESQMQTADFESLMRQPETFS